MPAGESEVPLCNYSDMRNAAALGFILLAGAGSPAAAQSNHCSRETLTVTGTPLSVTYCVTGTATAAAGHELPVHVSEAYSARGGAFSQAAVLQFIAGEPASRVIEDVPLDRLGLRGTLHLTLVYRAGFVRLESALLTPGAITLK